MIYIRLQEIQTILQALQDGDSNYVFGADGTNVHIGTDFPINAARLPLGFIYMVDGDLKNKALVDSILRIGGVVYNEAGEVYQTKLDTMELLMKDTDLLALGWLSGPVSFSLDPDILLKADDKYFELQPPYGGFELEYRLNRGLYT